MTDEEKRQYELARLGLARMMGDASEVTKWSDAVSQTRAAEQRNEAVATAQNAACLCGWHYFARGTFIVVRDECPIHGTPHSKRA